jgi:hypothetical protein
MTYHAKTLLAATSIVMGLAGAGFADPVTGKDAGKMMFSPKGAEVEMLPVTGLSQESAALLQQVIKDYAYYAAVAIAPDEDIMKSEATMLVANHHSVEAASAAALAGCNKVRQGGSTCVVAAVVRPKKWDARAVQLSVEGTLALKNDYGRKGERAMAISAKTGFFAVAQGAGAQAAALKACAEKGADDCSVAVADAE